MRGAWGFVAFLAAVAAAAAAGFFAGREASLGEFERGIAAFEVQHTLGRVIDVNDPHGLAALGDPRSQYALAYHDPARAEVEMDGYVWAVPSTPTPFVDYAPAPGHHASATINAQQFRHDRDLTTPKPPGLRRLFLLGGSTAFGSGAPSQDRTISGYLQQLLDERGPGAAAAAAPDRAPWEVVNAASPGWASTHERIWAIDHVLPYEPDLVVAFSGLNDVHWSAVGFDVRRFRPYDAQHYFALLSHLYHRTDGRLPDVAPLGRSRVAPEVVAERLVANLRLTASALRAHGVPYVFVLQPSLASSAKPLTGRERRMLESNDKGPRRSRYLRACYAAIRRALASEGAALDHLDMTGVFDASGAETEIFLDSYHFGDRGNELIARALAAALEPRLARGGGPRGP